MSSEKGQAIAVVGDSPESIILSVMLAESGIHNELVGSYAPPIGQSLLGNGAEQAKWLVKVHSGNGKIKPYHSIQDLQASRSSLTILTDTAGDPSQEGNVERRVRQLAPFLNEGQTVLYTGLCPLSFVRTVLKPAIAKHTGLIVGEKIGLCYMPLLWNGESMEKFREMPKVIVGEGPHHLQRVQETLFSIFPSLTVAPNFEAAETAGLFGPAYREVLRALELELAEMCSTRKLDYSSVAKLCARTGTPIYGSPTTVNGRDPIASRILIDALGNRNRPTLVRTARKINDEAPQQVFAMVKGALARCGRGVRRSKIAILGLDQLGVEPTLGFEQSEVIATLVRRGAIVSVYPAGKSVLFPKKDGSELLKVKIEPDLTRAVQKAQCAIIAFKPVQRDLIDLNPQKLAAVMDRPAAICDLSRVLEASNVERTGLYYTSIGRGWANP